MARTLQRRIGGRRRWNKIFWRRRFAGTVVDGIKQTAADVNQVVFAFAEEDVISKTTEKLVAAGACFGCVRSIVAIEVIDGVVIAGRVAAVTVKRVVLSLAEDEIGTRAPLDHIVAVAGVHDVIARSGVDQIIACVSINGVLARTGVNQVPSVVRSVQHIIAFAAI